MKHTGIVRRTDKLGRVVLPKELRETFHIKAGDSLELFFDEVGAAIILVPYRPGCFFCEQIENLVEFQGKKVCGSCLDKIRL